MKASVKWTGSSSMVGINDKGQEVKMDWEEGGQTRSNYSSKP